MVCDEWCYNIIVINLAKGESILKKRNLRTGGVLILIFSLLISFMAGFSVYAEDYGPSDSYLGIEVLDVGQGLSVVITTEAGTALYDGGPRTSSSKVVSYLKSTGVQKLDYVIASHYDEDHLNGLIGAIHALDVARGDVRQRTHERHAVKHDERVVGRGQRALATDADLHRGTRLGTGLGHLDTGHAAFEGAGDVAGGNRTEVVTAHGDDGAGHILAAGGTVTDNHCSLELLGILRKDHVDPAASLNGNQLGLVADAGDLEGRVGADLEGIRSVDTRDGAVLRICDHHGCADDGLPACVPDGAADGDVLRKREERHRQASGQNDKRFLKV